MSLLTTTAADAVSYTDTNLSASTTYYYRVKAANTNGDSAWTSTASATTEAEAEVPSFSGGAVVVGYLNSPEFDDELEAQESEITIPTLEKFVFLY